jgi:hypothetical protein
VAAIPGVPRWVQGIVAAVLRDNGQLDREERNDGGGAAVSVETPHQLLQGTIIAAAASYAAYLVALYVLRSVVHVAMLVPTGVYVGLVVVVGAATAAAKRWNELLLSLKKKKRKQESMQVNIGNFDMWCLPYNVLFNRAFFTPVQNAALDVVLASLGNLCWKALWSFLLRA